MSDTDDTDSLLSVAAPSGLNNFLGLSVEEMSSRINSLTNNSNSFSNNNHSSSGGALTREDVRRAEYVKNDILSQLAEYSDSDGDLNDDDDAKSETGSEGSTASTNSITMLYPSSETKEDDLRLSNLQLVASIEDGIPTITSVPVTTTSIVARNSSTPNHENLVYQDTVTFQNVHNYSPLSSSQQVMVQHPIDEKYKLPTYGVRVSHGIDFMRQSPNTTGWRYTAAHGSDPQIISRAPNFRTPGGYKPPLNPVPPRDLSDAQVHEEVKRMYQFPDDDLIDSDDDDDDKNQSSSPVINNNSQQNQILTTGRHPAGNVDDGGGDCRTVVVDNEKIDSTDIDNQVIVQNDKEEEAKSNDDDVVDSAADGGVEENPFIASDGKPVKRKLFSAGDTVGSIPDLGFGLRDFDKLEVVETPVVPHEAWLSDVNSGGQARSRNDKHYFPSTGSAQFRDENNLEISPIKAAYLENSKNSPDINRCLPRVPRAARQLKKNYISSPKKVSLLELDLLWKDIQRTKSAMEEEMNKESANLRKAVASTSNEPIIPSNNADAESHENKLHGSKVSFQEDKKSSDNVVGINQRSSLSSALENLSLGDGDISDKNILQQKSILKSKSPGRVKKSVTTPGTAAAPSPSRQLQNPSDNFSFDMNSTGDDLTMMSSLSLYDSSAAFLPDLDTIDFSSILSAAHMKPSEFDDILSRLDDFSDIALEQMTGADEEIEDVVTKLEVADWAKSGATEYVQKYYDEKNRRELCETENGNLNKIVLKLKQELAVKSTMLKKKDGVLLKMTKAWHDITSRWKDHEKSSREILHKLQQDHAALLEYAKKSKERIDGYEKELANAVDLAGTFKSKLEALEKTHCDNVEKLEGENNAVKEKFVHLQNTLDSIKDEKDAAVRALSESQKQLDERNAIHEELQEKLTFVQLEAKEGQKDFTKILKQKQSLEEYLQSVTVQKDALEMKVAEVVEKLEDEKAEKAEIDCDTGDKEPSKGGTGEASRILCNETSTTIGGSSSEGSFDGQQSSARTDGVGKEPVENIRGLQEELLCGDGQKKSPL